jgi:hypothetical protein
MKLQAILYIFVSTALTAVNVHALPSKSNLLSRTSPSLNAPLAPDWRVAGPCMILNNASDLNGVRWSIGTNTPERCTAYCNTAPTDNPPHYTYAAVGGDPTGCYCGFDSDYNQVLSTRAFDDECDASCAGDSSLACGRGDRVQVYTRSPPPTPALPYGWSVASACSVDDASRVLQGDSLFSLSNNTPANCASWCASQTYSEGGVNKPFTWAGVENGNECHCGHGWKGGVVPPSAPTYDCATPCTGNPTDPDGCGGSWRIQVFTNQY